MVPNYIKIFICNIFAIEDFDEATRLDLDEAQIYVRYDDHNLVVDVRSQDDFHDIYLYNRYTYKMGDVESIADVFRN